MNGKKRSIWKNLLLALASTPMTVFAGLIIITLIGGIDQAISKIQLSGHWWFLLLMAYALSLIYFLCEPTICRNQERKKAVNGLILYWEEQLAKQNATNPSEYDVTSMEKILLERIKVWAWSDPELWARYFPEEKYSEYLFGIVDSFMAYWKNQNRIGS